MCKTWSHSCHKQEKPWILARESGHHSRTPKVLATLEQLFGNNMLCLTLNSQISSLQTACFSWDPSEATCNFFPLPLAKGVLFCVGDPALADWNQPLQKDETTLTDFSESLHVFWMAAVSGIYCNFQWNKTPYMWQGTGRESSHQTMWGGDKPVKYTLNLIT